VLKIPNAAFRFRPADVTPEKIREMMRGAPVSESSQARRQQGQPSGESGDRPAEGNRERREGARSGGFAPSTSAVLAGQSRLVWVLGPDKKPQPRRIKVGITDGVATEIVQSDLKEGELVIVGQNVSGASRPQANQTPPGFGGMPGGRGGGGGGRR